MGEGGIALTLEMSAAKTVDVTVYPMNDQLIVVLIAGLLSAGLIVGGFAMTFKGQFQAGAVSILVGCGIGFWLYRQVVNK